MSWHLFLLLLSAVAEVVLLLFVRARLRTAPTAGPFSLVLVLNALWAANYALDLASTSLEEKFLLLKLRSTFLPFYAVAWFETAYRFAVGRPALRGWALGAALVIPVITVLVAWVPGLAPLAYHSFYVEEHGPIAVLRNISGPWTHVYNLYNYTAGVAALYFVLRARLHGARERRWQIVFVLGSLLGIVADVLYEFNLSPTPGLNYAPIILPLTSGMIAVALLGGRLANLAPVARAAVIEQLDQQLFIFDARGDLIDLNRAAAQAIGQPPARVIGRPAVDVLNAWPAVARFVAEARPGERREIMRDGSVFEAAALPVDSGPGGFARGRILSLTDLTARKRIEVQLRLAKESAEAAEAAQSRFLAMMSHEVRTPLNGMLGFAQLLAQSPLSDEQREQVEMIDQSGRSLLVILNDVLDYSKIVAGRLEVERVRCNVAEIAAGSCRLLAAQAEAKGLRLSCEVAPDFPTHVVSDPVRIGQILVNLIGNALKFTPAGEVVVHLAHEPRPAGPRLRLSVRDTGIGISPEAIQRIFEPFAQADTSTTRRFGGTGLGLTITRSLCELLGGSLSAESTPGRGSVFTATLQALPDTGPAPQPPPRTTEALRPLDVLVFEDNLVNQRVIRALLEKEGHRVRLAEDGEAGLARWLEAPADVVLMDIEMPRMDGFEAVKQLRTHTVAAERPRQYIIALTAHAMAGERERALAAGCDDFLTKPVRVEALREALAKVPRAA